MRYLLDTNHWSYLQEGRPAVVATLQRLPEGASLFMSVVTQAELLGGVMLVVEEGRRRELFHLYYQAIQAATEILPITTAVAERFAQIHVALRRKGTPIETNDIWIAASAEAYDLTLVTNDSHFDRIHGLRLEDWTCRVPE